MKRLASFLLKMSRSRFVQGADGIKVAVFPR